VPVGLVERDEVRELSLPLVFSPTPGKSELVETLDPILIQIVRPPALSLPLDPPSQVGPIRRHVAVAMFLFVFDERGVHGFPVSFVAIPHETDRVELFDPLLGQLLLFSSVSVRHDPLRESQVLRPPIGHVAIAVLFLVRDEGLAFHLPLPIKWLPTDTGLLQLLDSLGIKLAGSFPLSHRGKPVPELPIFTGLTGDVAMPVFVLEPFQFGQPMMPG